MHTNESNAWSINTLKVLSMYGRPTNAQFWYFMHSVVLGYIYFFINRSICFFTWMAPLAKISHVVCITCIFIVASTCRTKSNVKKIAFLSQRIFVQMGWIKFKHSIRNFNMLQLLNVCLNIHYSHTWSMYTCLKVHYSHTCSIFKNGVNSLANIP